jgi:eukaryotic-like serine/threonine-protein kinase
MSAARRESVKRLLQTALARPSGERERFLDEECASDDALRREVQSLLARPSEAGRFLQSEPLQLERGTRLGPYEIISLIGAGGMGEVYRARDTRIQREVAIKCLPHTFSEDPERLERFEREATLAGSLNHPNLVTIHDVGTHEGAPFVVMELLRGRTLRDELRRGSRLAVPTAINYALQIASGLGAAHEQGIVHRDLKPGNLFITDDGRVKILDFGLAKIVPAVSDEATIRRELDYATGRGMILGTVPYMSPEQLNGEPVDPRSDIFSFGVILYEMLSGRDPFKRDSAIKTMHAIVSEEPVDVTDIPPLLNGIIRRCIQKKRAERFQSARDVGYALELAQTAVDEVVPVAPQAMRWRVWLATAAFAGVMAAAAIGFLGTRDAKPVSYERITFRRGLVTQARFAPDGQTVIYSAAWDGGPLRIFMKRPDSIDSVAMDLPPADLLSVSRSGELAILIEPRLHVPFGTTIGTLARVSMNGGAPRRMIENVLSADWSPDERLVVVARDTGEDQRLEIRSADGAQLVRQLLVTSSGALGHVRFSPAGDRIAFTVNPNRAVATRLDVAVINADGTGQRTIGRGLNFSNIVWSLDGREILFAQGSVPQTAVRAASISGETRTVFETPGNASFSDVAGGKVLLTQNELAARVSCLARGANSERDASWRIWSAPLDLTADGGQLLLNSGVASTKSGPAVGLQPLDGSPIIELARDASPYSFSADERSVLVARGSPPLELAFVPVGPGETQVLPPTGFDMIAGAAAAPNGKTVILAGVTNETARLYELPIAGGPPRKISDDPLYFPWLVISPDSALVAAVGPTRRLTVYRVADGEATVIESSIPGDFPVRFADDGSLLFTRVTALPNPLYRFDFNTQRQTLIREFAPADRAGVLWAAPNVRSVTADAQSYCYQYAQVLSKLMVAEGLDVTPPGRFSRIRRAAD